MVIFVYIFSYFYGKKDKIQMVLVKTSRGLIKNWGEELILNFVVRKERHGAKRMKMQVYG